MSSSLEHGAGTEPEPVLVTVAEAARRLSLSRTTTYDLLLSGRLESVKVGRARRVVAASIPAFIDRLAQGDTEAGH